MTIDQLNTLSDEEVRERVANILFPQFPTYWDGENLRHRYPSGSTGPAFNYPADLNAAFTLVEKLKDRWNCDIFCTPGSGWKVVFSRLNYADKLEEHAHEDPSLCRAICLSFLAVTEREEG